jgi:hypothetical protein
MLGRSRLDVGLAAVMSSGLPFTTAWSSEDFTALRIVPVLLIVPVPKSQLAFLSALRLLLSQYNTIRQTNHLLPTPMVWCCIDLTKKLVNQSKYKKYKIAEKSPQ